MGFIDEKSKPEIMNKLNRMKNPVEIIIFTDTIDCALCPETIIMMEELASLSENLNLAVHMISDEPQLVETYHIDKVPGLIIKSQEDLGIRYYGMPAGYEFGSLLEDIIDISNGDSVFTPQNLEKIALIQFPVHLQVFVAPDCPYCPSVVRNAHKLAMVNRYVQADIIMAREFPELTRKYNVREVPRTMVNEDFHIDGGMPEEVFINQIIEYVETQTGAFA